MDSIEQETVWSARYRDAGDQYVFGTEPNRFLARNAALFSAGQSVLAVADGEGRNAVWLAGLGLRVTATDISPVALAKARKLAEEKQVVIDFVQADAASWNYPRNTFDVVVGIFIQFANPAQRAAMFSGMKNALKSGGLLLLQGYTIKQLEYRTGGPSAAENLYDAKMLRQAFKNFEIIQLEEYEDVLDEGIGHKGQSALISLIACKY